MNPESISSTTEQPSTPSAEPRVIYVEKTGNGLAVAALVLGIIGVVFGLIPLTFFIALILGVVGLVLGIAGIRRAKRTQSSGVITWTGTILCLGAIALGIWGAVIVADTAEELDEVFEQYDQDMQRANEQFEREMQQLQQP